MGGATKQLDLIFLSDDPLSSCRTMEASFPRGARPRSQDDKKKPTNKRVAAPDFLFGGADKQKKTVKRAKKAAATKTTAVSKSLLPVGGGGVIRPAKGSPRIESLSFSKLAKGFRLLAICRQVNGDDAAVFSLPNQWTGYMKHNASSVLVGQIMSVEITKAVQEQTKDGAHRRIEVTVDPSVLNPRDNSIRTTGTFVRGTVTSVEDHGLLIDLGLKRRGFLAFGDIHGEYSLDRTGGEVVHHLFVGRCQDFVVKGGGAEGALVPLELPLPRDLAKLLLPATYTPTLRNLQPGTLVQTTVDSVVKNGVCVTFGGGVFRGSIELPHLGCTMIPESRSESEEWKPFFESHRSVRARIVAVDPTTKIVRLSLLPHLVGLQAPVTDKFVVGSIHEGAVVARMDPGVGALLVLTDTETTIENRSLIAIRDDKYADACGLPSVYVHISRALDSGAGEKTSDDTFSKTFAPSTKHTVRILGFNSFIEGIASAGTAPSILGAHVLTYNDLEPGMLLRQVPVRVHLKNGGVIVDFGMGICGLLPPEHMHDQGVPGGARSTLLQSKFAVDTKVDVRVLSVDPVERKCMVTAKKSLLKAENVITSFDDVKVGQETCGFVSKVDRQGLSVTFFGGVYGRVTARSLLRDLDIEAHQEHFSVGDVVECHVAEKKLRKESFWELVLRCGKVGRDPSACDVDTPLQLKVGGLLPARSMRIVELTKGKTRSSGYVPGYAVVSIKGKYITDQSSHDPDGSFECKLPFDQLLDSYSEDQVASAASLDSLAESLLLVGKKINRRGIVLRDPCKSSEAYKAATGTLAVLSIRPKLVEAVHGQETRQGTDFESSRVVLPCVPSDIVKGATLIGFVANVHPSLGAFVHFVNGMTGLVPKKRGGLLLPLYETITTQVVEVDNASTPMKFVLAPASEPLLKAGVGDDNITGERISVGDRIERAAIEKIDFYRSTVKILDSRWSRTDFLARVHVTMAKVDVANSDVRSREETSGDIAGFHPFGGWNVGQVLVDLIVVAVESRKGKTYIELSNRADASDATKGGSSGSCSIFFHDDTVPVGTSVQCVVDSVLPNDGGIRVLISPGVSGIVPVLELSSDLSVLNELGVNFPRGACMRCTAIDARPYRARLTSLKRGEPRTASSLPLLLSAVNQLEKPAVGSLLVGRVCHELTVVGKPARMFELRGGYAGRCCATELNEVDEWMNMTMDALTASNNKSSSDNDVEER